VASALQAEFEEGKPETTGGRLERDQRVRFEFRVDSPVEKASKKQKKAQKRTRASRERLKVQKGTAGDVTRRRRGANKLDLYL